MTDDQDAARRARHAAIRAEYADEEAEAAELEAAQNAAALDVPLNLRITQRLSVMLRQRAAAENIPTSALVRRLLTTAVTAQPPPALTIDQVETIARRIAGEAIQSRT